MLVHAHLAPLVTSRVVEREVVRRAPLVVIARFLVALIAFCALRVSGRMANRAPGAAIAAQLGSFREPAERRARSVRTMIVVS